MNRLWVSCALLSIAASIVLDAGRSPSRAQAACSPANAKVVDAYKAPAPAEQAVKNPDPAAKSADPAAKGTSAQPAPERIRTVQLGDTVAIDLERGEELASEACRKKPLILYLNGLALKGVTASPADPQSKTWNVALRITDESREAWSALLGRPDFATRKMTAGLGFEDQPLASDKTPILEMKILPTFWVALWGGIFLLMLAVFICSALHTNILRGGTPEGDAPAGALPAYSLSKSQAALWFFIILASYLLIGIVTGDFSNSLNGTALILLGIGGGTVLGSAVIDNSKATPEQKEAKKEAAAEAKQTCEQLTAAIARTQAAQAVPAQAAQIPKSIATLPAQRKAAADAKARWAKLTGQSTHFLTDILSDANGVSFHRFQMAVWTVVLSIIFIKDVYLTLAMPTFNATLLGLLGLSAGTYLGLKIPEPAK